MEGGFSFYITFPPFNPFSFYLYEQQAEQLFRTLLIDFHEAFFSDQLATQFSHR